MLEALAGRASRRGQDSKAGKDERGGRGQIGHWLSWELTSIPCNDRRPAFVGQLKVGDYFVDSHLSTQVLFWLGLPAFWSKGPVR